MKRKLPKWLVITGQSGAGKGTLSEIFRAEYKKRGIPVLFVSNGDLIRKFIGTKTYIAKKMEEINNKGMFQPNLIGGAFWFNEISQKLGEGDFIIHEGTPQFSMMQSLVEIGYIDSLVVVEVTAPDEVCKERLVKRTHLDGRKETSMDGILRTPDMKKIETKMKFWTDNQKSLLLGAREANSYISIKNTGTIEDLKKAALDLFEFGAEKKVRFL